MKAFTFSLLAGTALAYPGMSGNAPPGEHHAGIFKAIIERASEMHYEEQMAWKRSLDARQAPAGGPPPQPVVLLGDLQEKGTGGTAVNDGIMDCFRNQNGTTCESFEEYTPPKKDTTSCEKDTCCIWSYIKDDLVPLFTECDGTCNDVARASVRFGFHDAAAWHQNLTHGGADGSILLDPTEVLRPANAGLDRARNALLPVYEKYKSYGISAADLVQFAHNVAVVTCPLGPRTLTYIGRPEWDPKNGGNTDGLLPDANDNADNLIKLFVDKTIQSIDLAALVGAHTSAKQRFFDTTQANKPFDSTPGVWDVSFYADTLSNTVPEGVFRLPSDNNLANKVNGTRNGFLAMGAGFPLDNGIGQTTWNGLYSKGYIRLSLLGVNKIQGLTDCTKVLPVAQKAFSGPRALAPTCSNDDGHVKIPEDGSSNNITIPDSKNGTVFTPLPGASKTAGTPSASATGSTKPVQATANAASRVLGGGLLSVMAAAMAFAL